MNKRGIHSWTLIGLAVPIWIEYFLRYIYTACYSLFHVMRVCCFHIYLVLCFYFHFFFLHLNLTAVKQCLFFKCIQVACIYVKRRSVYFCIRYGIIRHENDICYFFFFFSLSKCHWSGGGGELKINHRRTKFYLKQQLNEKTLTWAGNSISIDGKSHCLRNSIHFINEGNHRQEPKKALKSSFEMRRSFTSCAFHFHTQKKKLNM